MRFEVELADSVKQHIKNMMLDRSKFKQLKAVRKCLLLIAENTRHSGLQTHKYSKFAGKNGEEVFESYAENQTSGAY